MAITECFVLAVMSYDWYAAICTPVRYMAIMNSKVCLQMAAGSWISGFLTPIVLTFRFCASNEIDNFFCDLAPVMKLSCDDTHLAKTTTFIMASVVTMAPLLLTVVSNVSTRSTILRIPSTTGTQKPSTCSSHLIVVTLFYGTLGIVYATPMASLSPGLHTMFSLLYTGVTPMVNPIIYSLKETEVKEALRKMIGQRPNWLFPSVTGGRGRIRQGDP